MGETGGAAGAGIVWRRAARRRSMIHVVTILLATFPLIALLTGVGMA
ncbi:MAG: hypothetical protein ACK4MT_08295 [Thermaurantiacus tibetensis]